MFKHILVPLDGSSLAESALPVAASLSKAFKVPVTLLHVIEQDAPAEIHHTHHLTNAEEAGSYLSNVAQRTIPKPINSSSTKPIAQCQGNLYAYK